MHFPHRCSLYLRFFLLFSQTLIFRNFQRISRKNNILGILIYFPQKHWCQRSFSTLNILALANFSWAGSSYWLICRQLCYYYVDKWRDEVRDFIHNRHLSRGSYSSSTYLWISRPLRGRGRFYTPPPLIAKVTGWFLLVKLVKYLINCNWHQKKKTCWPPKQNLGICLFVFFLFLFFLRLCIYFDILFDFQHKKIPNYLLNLLEGRRYSIFPMALFKLKYLHAS